MEPEQRAGSVRLTATQLPVASMTAEGAEPRQIAASLFLTPRSVELTLETVREALGVSSGEELALAI